MPSRVRKAGRAKSGLWQRVPSIEITPKQAGNKGNATESTLSIPCAGVCCSLRTSWPNANADRASSRQPR